MSPTPTPSAPVSETPPTPSAPVSETPPTPSAPVSETPAEVYCLETGRGPFRPGSKAARAHANAIWLSNPNVRFEDLGREAQRRYLHLVPQEE